MFPTQAYQLYEYEHGQATAEQRMAEIRTGQAAAGLRDLRLRLRHAAAGLTHHVQAARETAGPKTTGTTTTSRVIAPARLLHNGR